MSLAIERWPMSSGCSAADLTDETEPWPIASLWPHLRSE